MKRIKHRYTVFLLINILFSCFTWSQDSTGVHLSPGDTIQSGITFTPDSVSNAVTSMTYSICPKKNIFWRAMGYSAAYNASMGLVLLALPEDISKWNFSERFKLASLKRHYIAAFTQSPVIDHDYWYINYIGHPYQGAYYFNSIRSQGASFWQSTLFNFGQSMVWEYIWEGGLEPPSIQDMIVTPVLGSLFGELTHNATLSMRKNGFRWYEKVAVCFINPAYAINCGFKNNTSNK